MTKQTKTVIVAGLGVGLGNALCRQLAGAGYRVARFSDSGNQVLLDTLGEDHFMAVGCDITNASQIDEAVSKIEHRFGAASVNIQFSLPAYAALPRDSSE